MAVAITPLFVGGVPGGMELAVILLIAILLFGANKIPKLARSTGQAMGEFQKGREEVEQELQQMKDGTTVEDPTATTTSETTADSTASETASSETASSDATTTSEATSTEEDAEAEK